jgi:hypothetical protein
VINCLSELVSIEPNNNEVFVEFEITGFVVKSFSNPRPCSVLCSL